MFKSRSFSMCTCCHQYGCHTGSHPCTNSSYVRIYELHGIIQSKPCVYTTARRIDVQLNISCPVCAFEKEELGSDYVCHLITYRVAEKDNPVHHQTAIDIHNGDVHRPFLNNVGS